MFYNFHYHFW